jgi:pimeloyl-ACP methyl ester carboxylesterase
VSTLIAGGLRLNYADDRRATAAGPPLLFHHGMGGDLSQPAGLLPELRVSRLITPDARGHGASSHLTSAADASFEMLADDLIRLADHLDLERFIVGGMSLGAGAALNLALRYPERIEALILARPAWLDRPMEAWKQEIFDAIAEMLEGDEAEDAAARLRARPDFRALARRYPATGSSLLGQLTRPQARESTAVLRGFPHAAPSSAAAAWSQISVPALVIAHADDPLHPYDVGQAYARRMPTAELVTIVSKEGDPAAFASGFQAAVQTFLAVA